MLSAFHSVVLAVSNFEQGSQDVSRLLGREPAWLGSERSSGARLALFRLTNTAVEVRGPEGQDSRCQSGPREAALAEEGEGLCGIRMELDDLSLAKRVLADRGIEGRGIRQQQAQGAGDAANREWSSLSLDPTASRSIPVELVSDPGGWALPIETGWQAPRSAVAALDHVVVFSSDLDATRDFYGAGLGIRLALDQSFATRGVRLLFFRLGGVTIEIGGRLGAELGTDARDRFGGLAWRVPDLDGARERLLGDGFDVSELRAGHKPGTRVATVRAPVHGVPTLLIEPAA